jgi:hypothetical protein
METYFMVMVETQRKTDTDNSREVERAKGEAEGSRLV